MAVRVKVALPLKCALGEGLHWDEQRNLLWFVDIYGPRLFWFNPDTYQVGERGLPDLVGWVLSVEDSDRVLVGLRTGVALLDVFDDSARVEWINRQFPSDVDHRLNDAKADETGRLWYGSMSATDESKRVGELACYLVGKGNPVVVDRGFKVTNGPAFNRDCTVMLHSDSAERLTYRYAMNAVTGSVTERSVWKQFGEDDGHPDGMTFDAEDCVWIAHWGASKLCRYDAHGNRLLTVRMPTSNVTNVCFGGKDLNRIFVTSAGYGLGRGQAVPDRNAGALFEVLGVNAVGLPPWRPRISFDDTELPA